MANNEIDLIVKFKLEFSRLKALIVETDVIADSDPIHVSMNKCDELLLELGVSVSSPKKGLKLVLDYNYTKSIQLQFLLFFK